MDYLAACKLANAIEDLAKAINKMTDITTGLHIYHHNAYPPPPIHPGQTYTGYVGD